VDGVFNEEENLRLRNFKNYKKKQLEWGEVE